MVTLGNGIAKDDLLVHDEKADEPSLAYLLSRMVYPRFPGVHRRLPLRRAADLRECAQQANRRRHRQAGRGKLEDLFASDETWTVE